MIAAMELRVVGTKHGTGIGNGIGSGYGVGALNIAMGAGRKTGTGTGRMVFDPSPVSTVSLSSSEHHSKILYINTNISVLLLLHCFTLGGTAARKGNCPCHPQISASKKIFIQKYKMQGWK